MPSMGKVPFEEMELRIGEKSNAGGPTLRLKTALRLFDAFGLKLLSWRFCRASTGRFWVTTWPKLEPNTPMSKPRPYPIRSTVFGSNAYAKLRRGANAL